MTSLRQLRLYGKRILITAGPTREFWDPVRFLSNPSSGQMGLALAKSLAFEGAKVTVVLGPVSLEPPKGLIVVPVLSALEMEKEVLARVKKCDSFIATAAVSDFRFEKPRAQKFKKGQKNLLTVRLVRNPDILARVGKWKGKRKKPVLVGFSLETEQGLKNAQKKLAEKNLDLIIGNGPSSFSHAMIKPLWIERNAPPKTLPLMRKEKLGDQLADWLVRQFENL